MYSLSLKHPLADPVTLSSSDVLKITLQTLDADTGKGIQPQQTFLRFYDESSGEEGIQPLRVTNGGKVKFELVSSARAVWPKNLLINPAQNMAKPPLSFPATSGAPLKVTLIVGTNGYAPLSVNLFDLTVPASAPIVPHADEASFHPLPLIAHTFRPDPKQPPKAISAVAAGLVLTPWLVLLGLVCLSLHYPPSNH